MTKLSKQAVGEIIEVPLDELEAVDISDKKIEQMARGFIMGSQAVGRRREIRQELEERVTKRIGKKGKYLVDKLFELIEGVYILDKRSGKSGQDIRYYQVPPKLEAIIYALDRVLGKPKQFVDKTEEKRGIILVEHVIKNLAMNPYGKNGAGKDSIGRELVGAGAGNDGGRDLAAGSVDEGAGSSAV